LTDEEIAAAEAFEAENREEFENATSLDVDGEFVDYESLLPDDEYEGEDELSDEEELEDGENGAALADVEAVYSEEEEKEEEKGKVTDDGEETGESKAR
jgi:hypothetical protein